MTENYPPEVTGLYPRVRGSFAITQVDGRKLYVPPVTTPPLAPLKKVEGTDEDSRANG